MQCCFGHIRSYKKGRLSLPFVIFPIQVDQTLNIYCRPFQFSCANPLEENANFYALGHLLNYRSRVIEQSSPTEFLLAWYSLRRFFLGMTGGWILLYVIGSYLLVVKVTRKATNRVLCVLEVARWNSLQKPINPKEISPAVGRKPFT